jgi:hypothetical protein
MPILDKPLPADKNNRVLLHAILFPKDKFTFEKAKDWLKVNNYKYIHNRQTKNIWRFRIREQIKNYKFYTYTLPNKVQLIYMYK